MVLDPQALIAPILSIFLFLVLCGALALVVISMRRPTTVPLAIAAAMVILALAVAVISPVNVPALMGLILAVLGVALAVLGGYPMARRVLDAAAGSRVRETEDGGIVVADDSAGEHASPVLLRGGATIGYLERLAAVVAILAGFPEALAVVVAVKAIGRFPELAAAEARERFIIGTLASLLWACVVGGLVRLAVW